MQQADGPPEQVDQWRLVIDDPERIEWRRAWLTGASNVRDVETERRYQAITIQKNDLTDAFEVTFTDNSPADTPGVAAFQTDTETEIGTSPSRQGAIKIAVEEMVVKRRDIAGNVDETTAKEWVAQRRPSPDFTGKALTDFEDMEASSEPEQSLRERLVDDTGRRIVDDMDRNWPEMPDRIGAWAYGVLPDGLPDRNSPSRFAFLYGTAATATDQPPRVVVVKRERYEDYNYAAYVKMPEVRSNHTSDPIVTANSREDMANRLVRYLNSNPPEAVDHPRWTDDVLRVVEVDGWELDRFKVTTRKTEIRWNYEPEAGNPDDCGPWRIKYEGQTGTGDYTFNFTTGPDLDDRVTKDSTTFQPESLDVVIPPTPSLRAVSDRARQIAAKITANPCDPWQFGEVAHPDPSVDTLSGDEVETRVSQAVTDLRREGRESDPDPEFMLAKLAEMLQTTARLDKPSMDRFEAATIQQKLRAARGTLSTQFDALQSPAYERFTDVIDAVADQDTHPAEVVDAALDTLESLAGDFVGGFDPRGIDRFR